MKICKYERFTANFYLSYIKSTNNKKMDAQFFYKNIFCILPNLTLCTISKLMIIYYHPCYLFIYKIKKNVYVRYIYEIIIGKKNMRVRYNNI